MKKLLAVSTVKKAFAGLGFEARDGLNPDMTFWPRNTQYESRLALTFGFRGDSDTPCMIIISGGRWIGGENVHILSYWNWPSSMAELNDTLAGIRVAYGELCNTQFEVNHDSTNRQQPGFRS